MTRERRNLLFLAKHEFRYTVSQAVHEIMDVPDGFSIEWVYDNFAQQRYVDITSYSTPEILRWRVRVSPTRWFQLSSPDVDVQFEALCKLRDLVAQIRQRIEATTRGGYA